MSGDNGKIRGPVNGTPVPTNSTPRKKVGKPAAAAGSGGAATGGGCGSHALIPDPQTMTVDDTLLWSLALVGVFAVVVWGVVAALAWMQRGDRS